MSNFGQRLVELWRGAGVTIRPPARPDAIRAFESKYGVVLPDDMRAYFLAVDGMEDQLDPRGDKPLLATQDGQAGRGRAVRAM